jgi:hypothetical protein
MGKYEIKVWNPRKHPVPINADLIFVSDVSSWPPEFMRRVLRAIKRQSQKTFVLNVTQPSYLEQFLRKLPPNAKLLNKAPEEKLSRLIRGIRGAG